jgi:hypothetical protein
LVRLVPLFLLLSVPLLRTYADVKIDTNLPRKASMILRTTYTMPPDNVTGSQRPFGTKSKLTQTMLSPAAVPSLAASSSEVPGTFGCERRLTETRLNRAARTLAAVTINGRARFWTVTEMVRGLGEQLRRQQRGRRDAGADQQVAQLAALGAEALRVAFGQAAVRRPGGQW